MRFARHRSALRPTLLVRLLLGLALALGSVVPAAAQPLRVMSYNVRFPSKDDGANLWEARRDLAAAMIRREHPDVIGTQELFQRQGDDLVARLPGFAWFGIDRRGGHADEHMGVLYDTKRLKLVQTGQFWLSDTPEMVASISWKNLYPRMVTWAIFERIGKGPDKGRRFRLLNTHFPYRDEDDVAREKGAKLIVSRLGTLPGADLPTVLTGDFNTTPESPAWKVLAGALTDTRTAAPTRTGPEGTWHAFTGKPDGRIDGIFVHGFTALRAETLTDHKGPVWTSDHFPIVADLKMQ
ncbi:endonuclease/exonuclease/phosphatase family protein [Sphingomonas sp. JC676]|uniref:endonuclease/exonuclease/phosphatase family protein n=1 Tax=Sphingomonas sp. JC676 TaxID=2768065 RepID=UPI0016581CC7|nr:endonuclease/exonuclease/phosphatase family protein [Sphingomonas sp. JC676]MBC9034677.1 endonuclease/exonuclease/phosphatase family protein [Sphingomonas sp. JC676]